MPKRKTNSVLTPTTTYVSRTIEARVYVNLKRLDDAIRETGRSERFICEDADIEPRNLANWRKGYKALRTTLELLAEVLEIDVRELIVDEQLSNSDAKVYRDLSPGSFANPFTIRKISGHWRIEGEDIVAPPDFAYEVPPKNLGGMIEMFQDERQISGKGVDHDQAPLIIEGAFIDPDHIRGKYDIEHPRIGILSGVLAATYQRCGTKITGHYLGREAGGYGQDFLLGRFTMTLEGSRDQ